MSEVMSGLAHLSLADAQLAPLILKYRDGISLIRRPGIDSLAQIITGQQLSGRAAKTIFARVRGVCGVKRLTVTALLNCDPGALREAGLSSSKVGFIIGAARAAKRNRKFFATITHLADEEAMEHLMRLNGVGAWTAAIYLMSCEGRVDIFPHGDGSIYRAIGKLYSFDPLEHAPRLSNLLGLWTPYRTFACRVLWRWVDDNFGEHST
jgi:DNA-3-methyladenine glycosylase II